MRRFSLLAATLAAVLALSSAAIAHPDQGVTDDPSGETEHSHRLPSGSPQVAPPSATSVAAPSAGRGARGNLRLVGSLELDPSGVDAHGDVWGHKNLAFVGKWRGVCPSTGVDIIDISDPSNPVKIADTRDYP